MMRTPYRNGSAAGLTEKATGGHLSADIATIMTRRNRKCSAVMVVTPRMLGPVRASEQAAPIPLSFSSRPLFSSSD